jgi:hypothetical protein
VEEHERGCVLVSAPGADAAAARVVARSGVAFMATEVLAPGGRMMRMHRAIGGTYPARHAPLDGQRDHERQDGDEGACAAAATSHGSVLPPRPGAANRHHFSSKTM